MKKFFLFVVLGFSDLVFANTHAYCTGWETRLEIQIRDVTTPGHPDRVRSALPYPGYYRTIIATDRNIAETGMVIRKKSLPAGKTVKLPIFHADNVFRVRSGTRAAAFCKAIRTVQVGRDSFGTD